MAGYIRQDTTGAISNNSIIEADDLNNEFDAVEGAFNATTGHTHDGTSAEGAPIEVVGPAQDVVITASTIRPKTDNAVDLGTSTLEFKDLYLDGTANIDNLVADAGTVAGSAITTAANTQTLTNKTLTSPVLNTPDINTPDIDGGTIDGTVIGATTPAAISGTAGTFTGNVTAGGLVSTGAASLTGSLTLNAATTESRSIEVGAGRTGDGNSFIDLIGDATYTDYGARFIRGGGANGATQILHRGTGPLTLTTDEAAPITLLTDSTERMRITSTGNVGIGTSAPTHLLTVGEDGGANPGRISLGRSGVEEANIFFTRVGVNDAEITYSADEDLFIKNNFSAGDVVYSNNLGAHIFNTGSAGVSEAVRITSAGNVGIGTSTPAVKLEVDSTLRVSGAIPIIDILDTNAGADNGLWDITVNNGPLAVRAKTDAGAAGGGFFSFTRSGNNVETLQGYRGGTLRTELSSWDSHLLFSNALATIGTATAHDLVVDTNNAERMRITSTGNVGIGTSSPATKLEVAGDTTIAGILNLSANTTEGRSLEVGKGRTGDGNSFVDLISDATYTDYGSRFIRTGGANGTTNIQTRGTGNLQILTQEAAPILFSTTNTERMRITSAGELVVGATSFGINNNVAGIGLRADGILSAQASSAAALSLNRFTSDGAVAAFRREGTVVGTISVTTTTTSYNITSDYRLKKDVQPLVGATDRVLSLKPCNFAWKADGSRTDGFIAHEVQDVVPEAVTGDKDGDEIQVMDQSKLVPLLTAALQDALKRIEALEAQLNP